MKFTKTTLNKIQEILEAQGYEVRYEKGNFQSGYCILEDKKIAVINKFFDTEGRINSLLEILANVTVQEDTLEEKLLKFYQKLPIHYIK